MKYLVCNEWLFGSFDTDVKEFEDRDKAIDQAKEDWRTMSVKERKKFNVYVLESVNPDEDADNHYDGNIIYECK